MATTEHLGALLREILVDTAMRKELVDRFQKLVLNGPALEATNEDVEIFADLAYDLNFYEPVPEARGEDPSFYGDERLEEEIRSALGNLGR
jgi:hypothetical protein